MVSASGVDRGHVLWAADPFKSGPDTERPLIVLSDDAHPFHGEQWIAAAVSTTPRPRALELTDDDWAHGTLPQRSWAYPWAIVSPRIEQVEYIVGSVTDAFIDELAVEVGRYIGISGQ